MAYNYFEQELKGVMTTGEQDAVKVKFQTHFTATKWLTLKPEEFEAIEAFLIELYSKRTEEDDSSDYEPRRGEYRQE